MNSGILGLKRDAPASGRVTKSRRLLFNFSFVEHAGEDAFAVWQLFAHLLFGWPGYLIANYTGARRLHDKSPLPEGAVLDHFRPWSKLFPPGWERRVALSTLGCVLTLVGVVAAGAHFGHLKVSLMYWPAYLWTTRALHVAPAHQGGRAGSTTTTSGRG